QPAIQGARRDPRHRRVTHQVMSPTFDDDLKSAVDVPEQVDRVVSLVPSLTESVAVTVPGLLVGATDWWNYPADLGGTRRRGIEASGRLRRRAVICIWRRPWMVVGRDTFAGDVLSQLGVDNVYADASERYPKVSLDNLQLSGAELVVLPDEPYVFTANDGPEA